MITDLPPDRPKIEIFARVAYACGGRPQTTCTHAVRLRKFARSFIEAGAIELFALMLQIELPLAIGSFDTQLSVLFSRPMSVPWNQFRDRLHFRQSLDNCTKESCYFR